ncbi:hypothetical protein HGI30_15300 [Paenibacillus albicereus]|uniref:Uncharacterized protein n=1 Tax=Paenibacillus albicereus TaxID=2726185 RepID=A0A6H2H0B8_9BACL|nr:hypothetical protein [Paenibacillus albicereus]QJC52798.1 hypothetical protein HGI30_15300 [Paenibacillus albicereus]
MSSFTDAQYLLYDAGEQLKAIEKFYAESIQEQNISPALNLKVKHYVEDLRSCLEYVAHHIHFVFCQGNEFPFKTQFPIFEHEDKMIRKMVADRTAPFKELPVNKPELWDYLLSLQTFRNPETASWLYILQDLSNSSKHRKLSPQRKQIDMFARHLEFPGITFKNCTFRGVKNNIQINGVNYDPTVENGLSSVALVEDVDAWVSFVFEELNIPVFPTLQDILQGVASVVDQIEEYLNE